MKKQFLTGALAVGTLAISSLLQANPAEAVGLDCDLPVTIPAYSNNVDATGIPVNFGCQRGLSNNDNVGMGILDVNTDGLFGFSDWNFAGKDENGGILNMPPNDISPEFPGNVLSGTYNLNTIVQASWTDVMLVLKGPNVPQMGMNPNRPEEYVGYLVAQDESGNWTGDWATPFRNTNSGNEVGVSHISLYYREDGNGTPIPTPALLPGLIGMGISALRKKKQGMAIAENA